MFDAIFDNIGVHTRYLLKVKRSENTTRITAGGTHQ